MWKCANESKHKLVFKFSDFQIVKLNINVTAEKNKAQENA